MQTYQRNSAAVLLEVNAVDFVFDLDVHIAPDGRLDKAAHVAAPALPRGRASTSLKNWRWLMNGKQVAFQTGLPAFGKREQVVPTGARNRLPELSPRGRRGAIRK